MSIDIHVRHAEPSDARAVHEMLVSGHVVAGTMRVPFAPIGETEERLRPDDGRFVLVAEVDDMVAGFGEMITHAWPRNNHVGEIDLVVTDREHQGQGIGRKILQTMIELSDDWLHLVRLQLFVWADNAHAIRLYEKYGFEIEGTLKKYVRGRGTYVDAHIMGRLRESDA